MKKIYLLLFAVSFTLNALAQKRVTSTDPINHNLEGKSVAENSGFGLKGGLNIATAYGEPGAFFTEPKKINTFHAGAYVQFSITDNFSLQPEILFSRKGFEAGNSGVAGGSKKFVFDYFDVPLLLSFRVLNNISLQLGPQASVIMTVKEDDRELDKAGYNSFDYGAAGGLEGRFSAFRVGARYNRSFENIYKEENTISPGNDLKNQVIQVYLGVGF